MLATSEAESARIAELFPDYLRWDRLPAPKQAELLQASLKEPGAMRRVALEWIVVDRKMDFEATPDGVVEALASCLKDREWRDKRDALLAIKMAMTYDKELARYLIQALDDLDIRELAVAYLNGARGRGPGPELPASATLDEKVAILKAWAKAKQAEKETFLFIVRESLFNSVLPPLPPPL